MTSGDPGPLYPDAVYVPVSKDGKDIIRLMCARCVQNGASFVRLFGTLDGLGHHITTYHNEKPLFFGKFTEAETKEEIQGE